MRLVLALPDVFINEKHLKKLAAYKYREEVDLMERVDPLLLPALAGTAYAVVAPAHDTPGWWLQGCLAAQAAVIAAESQSAVAVLDNAGLYLEDDKTDTLAQAMMQVYKEEHLRSAMADLSASRKLSTGWAPLVTELLKLVEGVVRNT